MWASHNLVFSDETSNDMNKYDFLMSYLKFDNWKIFIILRIHIFQIINEWYTKIMAEWEIYSECKTTGFYSNRLQKAHWCIFIFHIAINL